MKYLTLFLSAAVLIGSGFEAYAQQRSNQPWGFTQQNRASIAALMRQAEQPGSANGSAGVSADTLVCGGDATTSAKGNSTCIILNNSTGSIQVGQESNGSQTASTDDTINVSDNETEIDEVLETLTQ